MKIRRIDLHNFRQFYGRQCLDLSLSDDRNVTLVHAENGVGKTTLLNSVYWALFGDVTPRFEQRNRLVNFEAEQEGSAEASVEVEFEFDGRSFRAARRHVKGRAADEFSVYEIRTGSHEPLPASESFVNSVIPRAMAKYFFFDGEHAESFAAERNTGVGDAIRSMLGCDLAKTGIADLETIAASYTKQMGTVPGDQALEALQRKLSTLEDEQRRDRERLADAGKSIEQKTEQKEAIEERLRRTASVRELQQLRDNLAAQLGQVGSDLAAKQADMIRWIGENALAVVSKSIAISAADLLERETAHGRIPQPYNRIFIEGLLNRERCICDRELRPQTNEWAAVAALVADAGDADAMSRIIRAAARLRKLREEAQEAPRNLARMQEEVAVLLERRRETEQRLAQESAKLENSGDLDARRLEAARILLEKELERLRREVWQIERDVERREGEIRTEANKLVAQVSKNARGKAIMARRSLATAAAEQLRIKLAEYETEARGEIQDDINRILRTAARRDYRFRFDDDFTMSLHLDGIDGPVPKSGGENQLMSLAFTAALVDFARRRVGEEHAILSPGTVAPLVLDAPIGHLDRTYRAATARFLPSMASQILLLLSTGHTEGGVLDALAPRIGRQYVLVSENRSLRQGRGEDAIVIGGIEYPRSRYGQERNQVRLVEVESVRA